MSMTEEDLLVAKLFLDDLSQKSKCNEIETLKAVLEEIQEFRKNGITIEKALDTMCNLVGAENLIDEYRAIGTLDECRTAVERMKPKKPTDIVMAKDRRICVGRIGKCPCCGGIVAEDNFTCEDCFQVLDWRE